MQNDFGRLFIFNVGQGQCLFKVVKTDAYIIDFGTKKLPENTATRRHLVDKVYNTISNFLTLVQNLYIFVSSKDEDHSILIQPLLLKIFQNLKISLNISIILGASKSNYKKN